MLEDIDFFAQFSFLWAPTSSFPENHRNIGGKKKKEGDPILIEKEKGKRQEEKEKVTYSFDIKKSQNEI
jgi:hypothetical protein